MEHCRFRQQERAEYALIGLAHPGEVLREVIWPRLNLTRKLAAQRMGVSISCLSGILNERRRVSRNLTVKLAGITGTNAVFWLVLQAHYDAWSLECCTAPEKPTRIRQTKTSRRKSPASVTGVTRM